MNRYEDFNNINITNTTQRPQILSWRHRKISGPIISYFILGAIGLICAMSNNTFYCSFVSIHYIICECGDTFPTEEALKDHLEKDHNNKIQIERNEFKCDTVSYHIPLYLRPSIFGRERLLCIIDDNDKFM